MKRCLTIVAVLMLLPWTTAAQDNGRSLLSAARKRALDARGKEGAERTKVYEDCVRLLVLVPERHPKEKAAVARAWLELGRTYRRLDRKKEAEDAFNRVLLVPDEQRPCCDALHALASLLRKQKRRDEAKKALRRLVDGFPGQARSRALALIRLAGLERDAKNYDGADTLLRQCLKEHGDLWRQSVDALNALVSMKVRQKDMQGAREALEAHTASLRARFAGTDDEERLENALMKMSSRSRLKKAEAATKRGDGQD